MIETYYRSVVVLGGRIEIVERAVKMAGTTNALQFGEHHAGDLLIVNIGVDNIETLEDGRSLAMIELRVKEVPCAWIMHKECDWEALIDGRREAISERMKAANELIRMQDELVIEKAKRDKMHNRMIQVRKSALVTTSCALLLLVAWWLVMAIKMRIGHF